MLRRKLRFFLEHGVGAAALLWIPTLYLLHAAFTPAPPALALGAVLVLGMLLQVVLYGVSNRRFFIGARPPLQLALAGLGLATLAAGVAGGLPLLLHARTAGDGLVVRSGALGLAAAQLVVLQYRVFMGRVGFRSLVVFAEAAGRRARSSARVLLPVGTFQLGRVLGRLEELATARDTAAGAGAEAAREVADLVGELRLRWDDRFARFVPWTAAAPLLEGFLAFLGERHRARLLGAALERREDSEEVPVRILPVCVLAEALAGRLPAGARLALVSSVEDGGLKLRMSSSPPPDATAEPLATPVLAELRAALRSGVRISREADEAGLRIDFWFPPSPAPVSPDDPESRFGSAELELLEGDERPGKPKRVYRRGDEVLKLHLTGAFDPKPTLLEDEFYIMRRLSGEDRCFPEITGTGRQPGYHWVSYRFEEGIPLDEWLAVEANRSQWLRILLDTQRVQRRLEDLGVVHRDLNPGNFIVREDGSLVLIDFDQAVADAPDYRGADLDGAARGDAKNDLRSLIERAGLARHANEAVRALAAHWPGDAPFELALAGHLFPGGEPWDQLWYPTLEEVGRLEGRRVLDLGSALPLFGLFAASHGALVTVRPRSAAGAALVKELAPHLGGRLELEDAARPVRVEPDLAVCLEAPYAASCLEALPLEGVETLVVAWPDLPSVLGERLAAAGLGAPRCIQFTSRMTPLMLAQRTVR